MTARRAGAILLARGLALSPSLRPRRQPGSVRRTQRLRLAGRPGPPSPTRRRPGRLRLAGILSTATDAYAEQIIDAIEAQTGAEIVRLHPEHRPRHAHDRRRRGGRPALMDQWGVGRAGIDDGLVILFDLDTTREHGQVQLYAGPGSRLVPLARQAPAIFDDTMLPALRVGASTARSSWPSADVAAAAVATPARRPPTGPIARSAVPGPVDRAAVYDYAGIFSPEAIAEAEPTIDAIEARTGAEVVVYTQAGGYVPDRPGRDRGARPRPDRPVGRRARGLRRRHGDLLRPATRASSTARSSSTPRPASRRRSCPTASARRSSRTTCCRTCEAADFDGALASACRRSTRPRRPSTPPRSSRRARSTRSSASSVRRSSSSGCRGWAFFHWRRFGKDPVYLDDPSILMPAPPPDLTAASGAMVMDGKTSRRALTTAMLDLASRAARSRSARRRASWSHKVGIDVEPAEGDATSRRSGGSTSVARPDRPRRSRYRKLADARVRRPASYISPDDLPEVRAVRRRLRQGAREPRRRQGLVRREAEQGRDALGGPRRPRDRRRASSPSFVGLNHPDRRPDPASAARPSPAASSCSIFARAMPAVTMAGAMIRAMLAAYRRTLQKTMAQARSMQQVVDEAGLPWLDTPDQAVVWGTALGLQHEIEGVLARSLEDVKEARRGDRPVLPGLVPDPSGSSFACGSAAGQRRRPVLRLRRSPTSAG